MKILSLTLAMAFIIAPALAHDLGSQRPAKPQITHPHQPGQPDRQGGDTILDAVPLSLSGYGVTGSTVGYTDDYDEVCPYTGSTSPDVVYCFMSELDTYVNIDMYGSTYDTKIYVYDQDLNLVGCNDDFYPDYVSRLELVALQAGITYYLVIDGYGGDAGDYVVSFVGSPPTLVCPAGAELEGEPELVDGYEDAHNGGCNSPEFGNPFGVITQPVFCGVSGWFQGADGSQNRDTDWFEVVIPATGTLEITGNAERQSYLFELAPQDCGSVAVVQSVTIGPFMEDSITITGEPGSTVWLWVGPTTFDSDGEFDYVLWTNLEPPVNNETHSWTQVKGMFR